MINLHNFKNLNLFFVGIGGISMSALVHFALALGAKVEGSNIEVNSQTKKLSNIGVKIHIGHSEDNLNKNIDAIIYTGAIGEDNPEIKKAKRENIPCYERSIFLGFISKMYLNSIVVAGTHGKTTTTAMIGDIYIYADIRPTIHLGGESLKFGNYLLGNKDVFITEGCEYRDSIRYLHPMTTLITSIELDHTDYYKDYQEIEDAFLHLADNTRQNVLVFENIEFAKKITAKVNVVNIGFGEKYEVRGDKLTLNSDGRYSFDVYYNGYIGRFKSGGVGLHNAKNSLCAIAVGLINNISMSDIYNSLKNFLGVKRRFEYMGEVNGVKIICDYAHHPTEIEYSIATAKSIYGKLKVIFQPHTYSRTIGLKKEFLKCFKDTNSLVIFKTYPAREKYIAGGSAKELYNCIKHKNKYYCDTQKELKTNLYNAHEKCILVLGAGDIYDIVKKIVKNK